jgi:glutaminyl-tRNA synthetase
MEEGGKNFFRLSLGNEVRLKSAFIIKAEAVLKDDAGNLLEIHCTYDPDSRSGTGTEASQRKVKGTLHWVSVAHAIEAEVREYDRLFLDESPDGHEEKNFMEFINPNSLTIIKKAHLEPFLAKASMHESYQFQRLGYFTLDTDTKDGQLVFNKTVGLKDTWAKQLVVPIAAPVSKPQPSNSQASGQRTALNEIQQIGKKLTNLSGDKLEGALQELRVYAMDLSYDELEPLFGTAIKKSGTRTAVLLALSVLLSKGMEKTAAIEDFIASCKNDDFQLLREEAEKLS